MLKYSLYTATHGYDKIKGGKSRRERARDFFQQGLKKK